jgi:hypothetical protein
MGSIRKSARPTARRAIRTTKETPTTSTVLTDQVAGGDVVSATESGVQLSIRNVGDGERKVPYDDAESAV